MELAALSAVFYLKCYGMLQENLGKKITAEVLW